jgi:acetyl-CoA carboxylase biotin carboxyl carrier protein
MEYDEIQELVNFVVNKGVSEFALERKDASLKIKRGVDWPAAIPLQPIFGQPVTVPAEAEKETLHVVKSSIVGIFHESPAPGAPPFVRVGDTVRAGQAIGLIESVGLMNEIAADVPGEVVQRFAGNGQPVDYGKPLFEIRACE